MSLLGFFDWLASTAGSIALHESLYAYRIVSTVHVVTLSVFVGTAAVLDLRLLGVALRSIPVSEVAGRLRPWTMAGFALMTRTELLLLLIGGLFVMITASVILQVGYFKATKGKRIFRMAPLQHHFELLGWAEITIVVRFWILCGLFVTAGLGAFYWEWVTGV